MPLRARLTSRFCRRRLQRPCASLKPTLGRGLGQPNFLARRRPRAAGGLPLWIVLCICLAGLAWATRNLVRQAEAQGVAVIDPRSSRLKTADPWVLPEWEEELADVLARAGTFGARDRQAISALAEEVRALSFVAEASEPEVLWPDGLRMALRLRAPVACVIETGSSFYLPVAADGVILPGRASSPHRAHGGWLPVLCTSLPSVLPGERLVATADLAALSVAASLWQELPSQAREELGRVRIDASRSTAPDGLAGGVVIDLEGRRRIIFGRSPLEAPLGELPSLWKWAHVAGALELYASGERWDTYDVRWDEPVALTRPPPATVLAAARTAPASANGDQSERAR